MKIVIDRQKLKEAAEMAALCDHVYFRKGEEKAPSGWQMVRTSDAFTSGKRGFFGALYMKQDEKTGAKKYVFAFRGSDGNDLSANFAIAQGKLPRQFADAVDFVHKACDAEGIRIEDAGITGHSLGGFLARTAGLAVNAQKVWAFASPGPSQKTRDYLEKLVPPNSLPNDRIVHVRSKYDVIGLFGTEEKNVIELNHGGDYHSIKAIRHYLGQKIDPQNTAPLDYKPKFLERVFNFVSRKIATCDTLRVALRKLVTHSKDPRDAEVRVTPLARPAFLPAPAL